MFINTFLAEILDLSWKQALIKIIPKPPQNLKGLFKYDCLYMWLLSVD